MKKLLSLFLVLCLLLSFVGCAGSQASLQNNTQETIPGGTTLPLFWPPLPLETEETTEPTQDTSLPQQTEQEQYQPVATKPAPKPTEDPTDATYYPRDDQEEQERPDDVAPSQPEQPEDTRPEQQPEDTQPEDPQPQETQPEVVPPTTQAPKPGLDPNGSYDSKWDVELFIVTYGRLPNNFITKKQAERLGWDGGSVERYAPGKCIGGDRFYNNEGLLPRGYTYYECDIGTLGAGSRGAQRLVYTKTGLVYYTYNHYKSFTLLYGTP